MTLEAEIMAPAMLLETVPANKLPLANKVGYGFGQLIEITVGSMLNMFALYYTTAVCGLPGGLAGFALGAGLVIDAVADPLIGSLSDSWKSTLGRRVPFMVAALFPLLLSFNLLFALPSNVGVTGLFALVMALSITLRVSISIFGLPYQALGVDLSDDYAERSSMAAWRWGIGIMGTFAVIGLGYGVFLSGPNGLMHRSGYLSLTLALSVIILVGAAISIRTGLQTRHLHRHNLPTTEGLYRRLLGEVRELFGNPTFRLLFGSIVLLQISQGINQALVMHISLYFWRLDTVQLQACSLAAVMGLVVAAPFAGPILARAEKRTVLVAGLCGMAFFNAVPIILRLLNMLPEAMSTVATIIAVASFLSGLSFALSTIAFIAVVPDAVDEHEQLYGTRREGLFLSGWSFASKAATGMGLLVGGMVLQVLNFPAQDPGKSIVAMAVPTHTLNWLAISGGPGSGILAVLSIALICRYRIDKKAHANIIECLVSRRGEQP